MKLRAIAALLLLSASTVAADDGKYYHIHPQWSPDGERIVFYERAGSSLYASILAYDVGSQSLARLTGGEHYDANPVWHPTGKSIVYSSARPDMRGNWQLYQLDLDSGAETQLTNDDARKGHPYVSPDGNAIVFQQVVPNDENAFKTDVFLLDLESNEKTRLTTTEANEFHPKFGPSSDFIVYDSAIGGKGRLFAYDFQTKASSQLLAIPDDHSAGVPVVAPDGHHVAFGVGPASDDGMRRLDLAAGSIKAGTYRVLVEAPDGYMIGGATWSPDSRKIAFHLFYDGDARIYIYDIDTEIVVPMMPDRAFGEIDLNK